MRLLNSCTWEIAEFISENDIPPYAIVSHTWNDEEISFRDWETLCSKEVEAMRGYLKVKYSCAQAAADGLEWLWIDTCCIDKSSSAELSEAINSMFFWYRNAVVCYGYLEDVPRCASPAAVRRSLPRSRWFSRGWTLQELIAPADLIFYSRDWHELGTKKSLGPLISKISGIELAYLDARQLETASVAKRMSWAAHRRTTRTEDIAYCLLGIFNVYIPLLYGEGKRAFQRLQHEIMTAYPQDHTLFAWGVIVDQLSIPILSRSPAGQPEVWGEQAPFWKEDEIRPRLMGLLASSPDDFEFSSSFAPLQIASTYHRYGDTKRGVPIVPTQLGKGIRVELPETRRGHSVYHRGQGRIAQVIAAASVFLLCGSDNDDIPSIILHLYGWGDLCWGRTRELTVGTARAVQYYEDLRNSSSCYYIEPEHPLRLEADDFVVRREVFSFSQWDSFNSTSDITGVQFIPHERIFRPTGRSTVLWSHIYEPRPRVKDDRGFHLIFGRVDSEESPGGLVTLGYIPVMFGIPGSWVDEDGIRWYSDRMPIDASSKYCDLVQTAKGGVWILDNKSLPHVRIEVDRVKLDEEGGVADAISISVVDRAPYYFPRRRKVATRWRLEREGESKNKRKGKRKVKRDGQDKDQGEGQGDGQGQNEGEGEGEGETVSQRVSKRRRLS